MARDTKIPGLDNARGWYANIVEMVKELEGFEDPSGMEYDDARQRIEESVLSVEVRSGWYTPHSEPAPHTADEYRILLTTCVPALQLVGTLNEYGEPETAELESQDWFEPWTKVPASALTTAEPSGDLGAWSDAQVAEQEKVGDTLLAFARVFYFGE